MPKRVIRRRDPKRARRVAQISVFLGIVAVYLGYWISTPTLVEVPKIDTSPTGISILRVSLHNPTYKYMTGKILRVETLVDIPTGRGGTTFLQSVPEEYPFTLFPQSTLTMDIPMNSRVLPGFDYDIYLEVDGVGKQTLTVVLPETRG